MSTLELPRKPGRRFSRRITVAVMAWGMITTWLAMFFTPDLAPVVIPTAAGAVTIALGAYMGTGHADLRATLNQPSYGEESWPAPPGMPMPITPQQHRTEAPYDHTG